MKKGQVTDLGSIQRKVFSDSSFANRVGEAGLYLPPQGAVSNTTQTLCGMNNSVLVYNPTAAAIFIAFGDKAVTAPASAAAGIPVLPNSTVLLNSGPNEYLIASAAGSFAYFEPNE